MKFKGTVIKGFEVGKAFGIATANLEVHRKPLLDDGVYLVRCQISVVRYLGLLHIGPRKTFGGEFSIEVHLLDFEEDLYGSEMTIEVLDFLRETKKFQNADQLYSQVEHDIIMARKYFLRHEVWDHWAHVGVKQKHVWEAHAVEAILRDQDFVNADVILLYAPMREREVQFPKRLLELCPQKEYYFPSVEKDGMHFYRVEKFEHLRPGYHDILEPIRHNPLDLERLKKEGGLVFVPTVAVDKAHNRLGQGGGFYDRFFHQIENKRHEMPGIKTVAVLPQFAYLDEVPAEPHDCKVEKLILV